MAGVQDSKLVVAALRRLENYNRNEAFDPINLESRPTASQQDVITDFGKIRTQWIVAATQSGKSQTCSRIISWMLTETHPTWKRPQEWFDEPLLILVAGRTGKQIEESLLPKLESYLKRGTYKVVRIGNIAQRLELDNGNRVVFQSLENPNMARERIQSYVAHAVWVDEMPPTAFIIDELQRRLQARSGYFLASFTPLVVSDDIRKMVDAAAPPFSKKYKFTMFDNPLYADPAKREEILVSMANIPESVRNTRLYGEWSLNDEAVYYFDYDSMVEFPENYSSLWRHVESVDPALKSALGYTMWAENPNSKTWYCIQSTYVTGIYVPTELVKHVRSLSEGKNVVRRIADPHEVWYIQTAASMGIHYMGVHKKNERKNELIKQLQECLGRRIRLAPSSVDLVSELQECRWSDRAEGKIVNSSSYHLLDSAQYFCDNIPQAEKVITSSSWDEYLYKANDARKIKKEKLEKQISDRVERKARRHDKVQLRQNRKTGTGFRW